LNAAAPQSRKERIDRGIKLRTEGIYALMSWRELAYLTVPRLVLIVGLLSLPLVMPGMYWQRVVSIVCIYALLALSFDFLAQTSEVGGKNGGCDNGALSHVVGFL